MLVQQIRQTKDNSTRDSVELDQGQRRFLLAIQSLLLAEMLKEAGLPDGVINMLPGSGATIGNAAVASPDLGGIHFTGSRLWSDEVRSERASAHGVAPEELERFYASRSLLGRPVTSLDVAEAVAFLVSERSRVTTGAVIPVDGGVPAGFPR